MSRTAKVGYIGLGNAGYPLASLLPKAGYDLVVRDADLARSQAFAAEHSGVRVADQGPYDFTDVDILVTMLPNGDVVRDVLTGHNGVARGLKDGALIDYTQVKRSVHRANMASTPRCNYNRHLVFIPLPHSLARRCARRAQYNIDPDRLANHAGLRARTC